MMKRLRIPLLTAGGVVLCAFVLIPMAFDTLDIGPEIVEVSKSMLHMPSPTPTAEVAENFAITAAAIQTLWWRTYMRGWRSCSIWTAMNPRSILASLLKRR